MIDSRRMVGSRTWRGALWLVCLALITQAIANRAAADALEDARMYFDAGVKASGDERWEAARDYLGRSAALFPKAATLLNLAVAEAKLGLRAHALAHLDAFALVADATEHADLIERANALRVIAEQLPPGDSLELAPAAPPLDASPATQVPEPSVNAEPTRAPDNLGPAVDTQTRSASSGPLLGYATLAGSALLSGPAVGGGLWWRNRNNALERCASRVPTCDNRPLLNTQRSIAIGLTIGSATLALSALVLGTIWSTRRRARIPVREASLGWRGGSLLLSGDF